MTLPYRSSETVWQPIDKFLCFQPKFTRLIGARTDEYVLLKRY